LILADTSAWVEYLRKTGTDANLRMRGLFEGRDLAITDVVLMEVLAGARDHRDRRNLHRLLGRCPYLRTEAPLDFERAADIGAACRRGGSAVRQLTDCLIAAVAIRTGARVLHADRDFETIARFTALQLD